VAEKGDEVLDRLLSERRDMVLEQWLDLILETYPADSFKFLKKQEDPFHNPVGHTLRQETAVLYDALRVGGEPDAVDRSLDNIARIRAVQDGSATEAVAFVFLLKNVVRKHCSDLLGEHAMRRDLLEFESRIDGLALSLFDHYMKFREQIYAIRLRESKKHSSSLSEKAAAFRQDMDGAVSLAEPQAARADV